ncbi:4a-hydroxytetrahydrobiopterin dehydratase [Apostasia shenzhenica]|uniref:4a-hydroxytetrahydrobiopterin dehydratase n=1 Tax=Apostasia shenzhenica TaxID=1088818 RepID=A0A2I0ACQ3_9ASPA|nr:4a-hydroxytetrahydrobiopterin dehydratase [Apostasia shenzhenica]
MASTSLLLLPYVFSHSPSRTDISSSCSLSATAVFAFSTRRRASNRCRRICAMAPDLLGDFGARDPFPEEIESNFGEKVVGYESTEHRILIPNLTAVSLAERSCEPVSSSQPPLSDEEVKQLLKKVIGWRILVCKEGMKIRCMWRVRDYGCGIELITRIYRAVESTGHYPTLHLEQPNQVMAELWTTSVGGLSLNDFIVAAKIDQVNALDLIPKKRVWA